MEISSCLTRAHFDQKGETMSEQQTPLTYERILELFRQTREQFREMMTQMSQENRQRAQEFDRQMAQMKEEARLRSEKLDQRMDRTSQEISSLGTSVGNMVERMIGGDIVEQFQKLGYTVTAYSRNNKFGIKGTSASGEIDLLLQNGDVVILIEAKTTFKISDVVGHIERLEKYRKHVSRDGNVERRQFIGAIGGISIDDHVIEFAHRKGLYVIVQAGRVVEIVPTPEGFQARKW